MRTLLTVSLALAVASCGSGPTGTTSPADGAAGGNQLVVEQAAGPGSPSVRYTLRCAPTPGGDHPRATQACAALAGRPELLQPLPNNRPCTMVYGGPDRATVTGTWSGRPVNLQLSRSDGCHIAQWDALGPLLDRPVGATPPS